MSSSYDSSIPDLDEVARQVAEANAITDQITESQAEEQRQVENYNATREDPRNADQWGIKGVAKELQSSLSGGLQDTASSVTTFGERTFDAISGARQKEIEETGSYTPEWDPFTNKKDPIITKTWWGQLLRGTVHFGSLAVGTVLAAKGLAATGVPLLAGGASALLGAGNITRAIAIGGMSDLISKESDGHNALAAMRDRYGWIDTPLSTKETDHPIMMKMKNIVEGMGIGLAFDGAAYLLGKGGKAVKRQIVRRNGSIEDQTTTAALAQLRRNETQFRADKNKPFADRHQGAHIYC